MVIPGCFHPRNRFSLNGKKQTSGRKTEPIKIQTGNVYGSHRPDPPPLTRKGRSPGPCPHPFLVSGQGFWKTLHHRGQHPSSPCHRACRLKPGHPCHLVFHSHQDSNDEPRRSCGWGSGLSTWERLWRTLGRAEASWNPVLVPRSEGGTE